MSRSGRRARPTISHDPAQAWADSRLLAKLGANVGREAGGRRAHRRRDSRARLPARPGQRLRRPVGNLVDQHRRTSPATQLIQPGSRVSRAVLFAGEPADVQEFREWLQASQAARRAPAGHCRCEPADQVFCRSCRALPVTGKPRQRAAGIDCGRDVGATLCATSPGQRRA